MNENDVLSLPLSLDHHREPQPTPTREDNSQVVDDDASPAAAREEPMGLTKAIPRPPPAAKGQQGQLPAARPDQGQSPVRLKKEANAAASALSLSSSSSVKVIQALRTDEGVTCLSFGKETRQKQFVMLAVGGKKGSVCIFKVSRTAMEAEAAGSCITGNAAASSSKEGNPTTDLSSNAAAAAAVAAVGVGGRMGLHKKCSGHNGPVRSVFFLPPRGGGGGANDIEAEEEEIASAANDCTIRIWNIETGLCSKLIGDQSPSLAALVLPTPLQLPSVPGSSLAGLHPVILNCNARLEVFAYSIGAKKELSSALSETVLTCMCLAHETGPRDSAPPPPPGGGGGAAETSAAASPADPSRATTSDDMCDCHVFAGAKNGCVYAIEIGKGGAHIRFMFKRFIAHVRTCVPPKYIITYTYVCSAGC
eukprot:GHVU01158640.1.p1 GENE.GHVU01158640.1~~GHVU01158640.1.p1  ORF type:complete len:421 (+),score=97.13 GHVU01158640.1:217-1479(+)